MQEFMANAEIIECVIDKMKQMDIISGDACFVAQQNRRSSVSVLDFDYKSYKKKLRTEDSKKILKAMIQDGAIAENATIKSCSLRKEICYRDFDFLHILSNNRNKEIVSLLIQRLIEDRIVSMEQAKRYSHSDYITYRKKVLAAFSPTWTSFSRAMENIVFALSCIKEPANMVGIGIFHGYTMIWNCGSLFMNKNPPNSITGVDIDKDTIAICRKNIQNMNLKQQVTILEKDGIELLRDLDIGIDYLYLDAEADENGKGIYYDLLNCAYEKLNKGAWVLAHDTNSFPFQRQLQPYFSYVRNKSRFNYSLSIDVDMYGMELSVK